MDDKSGHNKDHNLLRVSSLKAGYGEKDIIFIDKFTVDKGEFIGLVGPNGAGKTTFLRVLTGIITPCCGKIVWAGRELSRYRPAALARMIAVVAQDPPPIGELRVEDIVVLGRVPYFRRFQWAPSRRDRKAVAEALTMTETGRLKNKLFKNLSGGEQQRVLLAAALAQEPEIIFLDEPTRHLDIRYQMEIFELLRKLNRRRDLTVITVLHDLNLAGSYCPRLIFMRRGRIFKDGSPAKLLSSDNLEDLYRIKVDVWKHPRTGRPVILPADQSI